MKAERVEQIEKADAAKAVNDEEAQTKHLKLEVEVLEERVAPMPIWIPGG